MGEATNILSRIMKNQPCLLGPKLPMKNEGSLDIQLHGERVSSFLRSKITPILFPGMTGGVWMDLGVLKSPKKMFLLF